jgi:hypothetical protein
MKRFFLWFALIIGSYQYGIAQFDTIVGPFSVTGALTVAEDKLYLLAAEDGQVEVWQIDTNTPDFETCSIFTNPFSTPAVSLFVEEEDLYVACAGATIAQGLIRRVININDENPTDEVYLELPWLPTNVAIKDSIMYISRLFFAGGGIYTYDMTDPDAQVELLLTTDANSLTDFEIIGDRLLISDGTDNRVLSVDLTAPNPTLSTIQIGIDFPSGIAVDNELLYVAVGNTNSNASSRVKVYEFNGSPTAMPVAELATTTNLILLDVARLNSATYVLEYPDALGEQGYLLRVQETISSTSQKKVAPVRAFPNPTNGFITIQGVTPQRAEVYDVSGGLVQLSVITRGQLDISPLSAGLYTVHLLLEDGTTRTIRVVKE